MYQVIENRPVTSKQVCLHKEFLEYVSCHWLLSVVPSPPLKPLQSRNSHSTPFHSFYS